ncbi:hypothetical protein M378DRAFT_16536 [Amanita muscaria Koide BX008]|uniref:Reverse transcriptase RNase H-like domain-containing protein n=1 Tax=Amanita muscaria (strain Koide BX008) TaxID=946122 RepID=A0A0C2W7D6_AMAMK|nr:hypothetical protein M378DRAFT_16536 [Amanita muscaria Koide BX008]
MDQVSITLVDNSGTLGKKEVSETAEDDWDLANKLIVEIDASDDALTAILCQYIPDGTPSYFQSLQPLETALEGSGKPIDVFTDHKNLEYFTSTTILTLPCKSRRT